MIEDKNSPQAPEEKQNAPRKPIRFHRWSRLVRLLFVGTLTSLAATGIVGYLGVAGVLPAVQRYMEDLPVTQRLLDTFQAMRIKPMLAGKLNILVADLDGDHRDGRNTTHVLNSLESQFDAADAASPVRVQRAYRALRPPPAPDTATASQLVAEKGREQLKRFNGDILVWGEVAHGDENRTVLRLKFLHRTASESNLAGRYALDQALELPENFGNDLGAALAAQVAADAAPAHVAGRHVAPRLEPVYDRLRALTRKMPKALTSAQRGGILSSFASVALKIADQKNDYSLFNEAKDAYRQALIERPRHADPTNWANTQTDLGFVLELQGWREDSAERFLESVSAYQLALEVYTRDEQPFQWARVKNGLCMTQRRLGAKIKDTSTLALAVAACRAALEIYDRQAQPAGWTSVSGNLAAALGALGNLSRDAKHLKEALAVYKAAQSAISRNEAPLNWARAQHDIGWMLTRIGGIEGNRATVEEAVVYLRSAMEELTRDKLPTYWSNTQNSYTETLLLLGRLAYREGDADHNRHFQEALKIREELAAHVEHEERLSKGQAGTRTAHALSAVSWAAIHARKFEHGLQAAERATQLAPLEYSAMTNKAHCLMLSGRKEEARSLYLKQYGIREGDNVRQDLVLADFSIFREIGLDDPLMSEVAAAYQTLNSNVSGSVSRSP